MLQDANGKVIGQDGVIYYGNLSYKDNGNVVVEHSPDNITGEGDGDDEYIKVHLDKLPQSIQKVSILVNIYDAANRHQDFGKVNSSFIRFLDAQTDTEFARHDLKQEFAGFTGVLVAEAYRMGSEWKAKILAEGVNGSISDILKAKNMQ